MVYTGAPKTSARTCKIATLLDAPMDTVSLFGLKAILRSVWEEGGDALSKGSMSACIIAVLMTMFLKFHIKLALSNKTTIENLEMKGNPYQSLYDISAKKNWEQVFGGNRYLWPFPVFCGSGKPLGDGIYWPTNRPEDNEKT